MKNNNNQANASQQKLTQTLTHQKTKRQEREKENNIPNRFQHHAVKTKNFDYQEQIISAHANNRPTRQKEVVEEPPLDEVQQEQTNNFWRKLGFSQNQSQLTRDPELILLQQQLQQTLREEDMEVCGQCGDSGDCKFTKSNLNFKIPASDNPINNLLPQILPHNSSVVH